MEAIHTQEHEKHNALMAQAGVGLAKSYNVAMNKLGPSATCCRLTELVVNDDSRLP